MKTFHWFGYVYLLKCGEFYKIGFSATPRKRLRQLRTGSPFPITVEHELRTSFYRDIERRLHLRFEAKRGEGEWFKLDERDVAYIKSLNKHGYSPEEQQERDESEERYQREQEAVRVAEENRRLAVLLSGAASGAGLCLIET